MSSCHGSCRSGVGYGRFSKFCPSTGYHEQVPSTDVGSGNVCISRWNVPPGIPPRSPKTVFRILYDTPAIIWYKIILSTHDNTNSNIAPSIVTNAYPMQQHSQAVTISSSGFGFREAFLRPLGRIVRGRSGDKGLNASVRF
jgi:hypothetical protein